MRGGSPYAELDLAWLVRFREALFYELGQRIPAAVTDRDVGRVRAAIATAFRAASARLLEEAERDQDLEGLAAVARIREVLAARWGIALEAQDPYGPEPEGLKRPPQPRCR